MGEHVILGRDQDYIVRDTPAGPTLQTVSYMDYQSALGSPTFWLAWYKREIINKVNGGPISLSQASKTTGPTSENIAISFASALSLGSRTLAAAGTFLMWLNETVVAGASPTTVTATIGGVAITLLSHGTSGGWSLLHTTAPGSAKTGTLLITPTGTSAIYDLRTYSSTISTAVRTALYNDVINNSGNVFGVK